MQVKRAVFGSILEQRVAVHNVATLGQHILKSTSDNVATSQRCDVSAIPVSPSLKAKKGTRIRGIGERTN